MSAGDHPSHYPFAVTWREYGNPNLFTISTEEVYQVGFPMQIDEHTQAMFSSFRIEWDCSWCGGANKIDQHLSCSHCGGPREALR